LHKLSQLCVVSTLLAQIVVVKNDLGLPPVILFVRHHQSYSIFKST